MTSRMAFYIDDVAGEDSHDGLAPERAWRTLERASGHIYRPGQEVRLRRGGRWEGTLTIRGGGSADRPVLIGDYGQASDPSPLIDGAGGDAAVLLAGISHCIVSDLVVENRAPEGDPPRVRQGICLVGARRGITEDVVIRDCVVRYIDGENRRVRGAYESMYWNGGIYVTFPGRTSADDHLHRIVVEHNHIHDVRTSGVRVNQAEDFVNTDIHHTNVVVRRNLIERTGSDGIIVANSVAPIIDQNTVIDAGALGTTQDTQLIAGVWVCATSDAVIQRNTVMRTRLFENDGTAFDTDWGTVGDTVFQYNVSYGNAGGFWLNCMDLNVNPGRGVTHLRYNVSIDDGRGLCLYDCGVPTEFFGNVFLLGRGAEICIQGSGDSLTFRRCVIEAPEPLDERWSGAAFHECWFPRHRPPAADAAEWQPRDADAPIDLPALQRIRQELAAAETLPLDVSDQIEQIGIFRAVSNAAIGGSRRDS